MDLPGIDGIGGIGGGADLARARLAALTNGAETKLGEARRAAERGDTAETARQFETLFATLLVRELRRAVPEGGLFGDGAGADVYAGWFDEHLGAALAEREALGIAGMIKASLARAPAPDAADGAKERA